MLQSGILETNNIVKQAEIETKKNTLPIAV